MLDAETWRMNQTPMSASRRKGNGYSPRTTAVRKEPATVSTTAHSRLYLAPAASKAIRRIDSGTCAVDPKTTSARRRRNAVSSVSPKGRSPNPYQKYEESGSDSSDSLIDNLKAPCLWMNDDVEEAVHERLNRSFANAHFAGDIGSSPIRLATSSMHACSTTRLATNNLKSNKHHHRRRRYQKSKAKSDESITLSQYNHDCEEGSVYSFYTQKSIESMKGEQQQQSYHGLGLSSTVDDHSHNHTMRKTKTLLSKLRRLSSLWHRKNFKWIMVQLVLVVAFSWVMIDSKHRQKLHQKQLQEYEEERAHILEQMTWIDAAAKRVHQKYAAHANRADDVVSDSRRQSESLDDLQIEKQELSQELQQMQHRVQSNARHRTSQQFGDRPVQVSIPLLEEMDEHVVIALQDDAPHAVSTFLQQINEKVWDKVDLQQVQHGRILQVSTRFSSTEPMLEFVEQSRGCFQVGGVVLHQLESSDFHVLVLKIHMEEHTPMDVGDVCIGTVVSGLDALEQMIPDIPEIRSKEVRYGDNESDIENYGSDTAGRL